MRLVAVFVALVFVAQTKIVGQSQDWNAAIARGNALRHEGHYAQAAVTFEEAVQMAERADSQPLQLASSLNALAIAKSDLGRILESENYYERALLAAEKAAGLRSVSRAQILVGLCSDYLLGGEFARAEKKLREAVAIYSELVPPDSMLLAMARTSLAEALLWQGALKEADTLMSEVMGAIEKSPSQHDDFYGIALNNKGTIRWAQGRKKEAIDLFRQSLEFLEQRRGIQSPILINSLNNLACVELKTGHSEEAAALMSRAITIAETYLAADDGVYGGLLSNYATCLKKSGRKAEAKVMEARAGVVLKESDRRTGTGFRVDVSALRGR